MKTINKILYLAFLSAFMTYLPGCYTVLYLSKSQTDLESAGPVAETYEDTLETDSMLSDEESVNLYDGYSARGEYIPSPLWIDYYAAPVPWWYPGGAITGGGGGHEVTNTTYSRRNYGQRRTAMENANTGGGSTVTTGTGTGSTGASTGSETTTNTSTATTTTTTTTGSSGAGSAQDNSNSNQNSNNNQRETTTRHTETNNERRDYGERGATKGGKK